MKIFDIDSPLMQVLGKISDLVILNLITVVMCIPIVTAGASFTAMHYCCLKIARDHETGMFKLTKGTLVNKNGKRYLTVVLSGQGYHYLFKGTYEEALANTEAEPWERYSAAVGMAELASDDLTIDLVFKRADKAMYNDKKRIKEVLGSSYR